MEELSDDVFDSLTNSRGLQLERDVLCFLTASQTEKSKDKRNMLNFLTAYQMDEDGDLVRNVLFLHSLSTGREQRYEICCPSYQSSNWTGITGDVFLYALSCEK